MPFGGVAIGRNRCVGFCIEGFSISGGNGSMWLQMWSSVCCCVNVKFELKSGFWVVVVGSCDFSGKRVWDRQRFWLTLEAIVVKPRDG